MKSVKYEIIDCAKQFDKNFSDKGYNEDVPMLKLNFKCVNNALVKSYGVEDFVVYRDTSSEGVIPQIANVSDIKSMFHFTRTAFSKANSKNQFFAITNSGKVYYSNIDDGSNAIYTLLEPVDSINISAINYEYMGENYIIFLSKNDSDDVKIRVYDGYNISMNEITHDKCIFDMAKNGNILYMVEDSSARNIVLYLNDTNPNNLQSNMGKFNRISIPNIKGKIIKLLLFMGDMYVFTDYAIYKIVAYADSIKNYAEEVYCGTSKILENTIAVGDNNVYFTTIAGMYEFTGASVKKLNLDIDDCFDVSMKNASMACYSNEKYYLITRLEIAGEDNLIADKYQNNTLVVYDVITEKMDVCYNFPLKYIANYHDEMGASIAVLANDASGFYKIFKLGDSGFYRENRVSTKKWRSQKFDMGRPLKYKLLKELYINSMEDSVVKVCADDKITSYNIAGSDKIQCLKIFEKTKIFSIEIISNSENPCIKLLKILVGNYE